MRTSDRRDPSPLAALDLSELPRLDDILIQIEPKVLLKLKPLLARLPLLNLLEEILSLAGQSPGNQQQQVALLDLARLAIAKHRYTHGLYMQTLDAVMTDALEDAEAVLSNLHNQDAGLVMEMLSLISEVLALSESYEKGVYAFSIAGFVADRFGLLLNRAVVLHQLGVYELRRGQFARAEAALKEAADIFSDVAPNLERRSNYIRAIVYKFRMTLEPGAPDPADIEKIAADDAKARDVIWLARARKALDRDDFATAEKLVQQLEAGNAEDSAVQTEMRLIQVRLARRKGQFEKADLLLKQARKCADSVGYDDQILWESFYLARDLGEVDQSQRLLEVLEKEQGGIRVDYQKALVAYHMGDNETAERLLRGCLNRTEDERARADCLGTLALVSGTLMESLRFMHEAIGLYVKLGRKLDHAVSLSHLAVGESIEGKAWKDAGCPMLALSQFTRADNLFQHAQEIAESLGSDSFLLDLIMNRARLESTRERYNVALRHFEKAATLLELAYLAMTDRPSADLYISGYTAFYSLAIECALKARRPDDALLFSERSKARRFLRDAAQVTNNAGAHSTHAHHSEEEDLLSTIRPLRSRLIQARSLSPQERQTLYEAEQKLVELWQRMRRTPVGSEELLERVHQPLDAEALTRLVFNREETSISRTQRSATALDEEIQELPGGGVMQCQRCFVYNRISSSFCSACQMLLPKSASFNVDIWLGNATPQELKAAYADELYNRGVEFFHNRELQKAEDLFRKAIEYRTHPDFSFYCGLCRLAFGDPAAALNHFDDILLQQYESKYPFWPLPVSPGDFQGCIGRLKQDQAGTKTALVCLMVAYGNYSDRRRNSK
jgi:tetratricopeptide (TPR) repeat protein